MPLMGEVTSHVMHREHGRHNGTGPPLNHPARFFTLQPHSGPHSRLCVSWPVLPHQGPADSSYGQLPFYPLALILPLHHEASAVREAPSARLSVPPAEPSGGTEALGRPHSLSTAYSIWGSSEAALPGLDNSTQNEATPEEKSPSHSLNSLGSRPAGDLSPFYGTQWCSD